jgi:polar amino acid transport system permease protein
VEVSADGRDELAADLEEEIKARRLRRPGRTVAAIVVGAAAASLLVSVIKNPHLEWHVVGQYLFKPLTLRGLWVTIWLTVVSMVIGVVGGVVVAIMRISENYILRFTAAAYVWFVRGVPTLVQIIFWGFLGAFYSKIIIGIPFTHITFFSRDTSTLISASIAAVLALGLNEIAYAAEIVRGGLLSVSAGQREAAYSLGMTPGQTMRRIVLPQAMRVVVPPMGNEVITMLKTTSLVSVIAGADLLTNLQNVYSQTFQVIPLLTVACVWYLVLATLLTYPQRLIERRYGRGVASVRRSERPKFAALVRRI